MGGVLCRTWEEDEVGCTPKIQILVPVHMRTEVLTDYHDHAGHVGMKRTYSQLKHRFYWHGMKRDTEDWIGSCVSCSKKLRPVGRGSGAPLQVTWSGYPFERIVMDIIHYLPETFNGDRYILVIVGYQMGRGLSTKANGCCYHCFCVCE